MSLSALVIDLEPDFINLWEKMPENQIGEVLRFALLRNLSVKAHTEISRRMSIQETNQISGMNSATKTLEAVSRLRNLETALDAFCSQKERWSLLQNNSVSRAFDDLFAYSNPPRHLSSQFKISELIPNEIKIKLEREDRIWERAIATFGIEKGFEFWSLSRTISASKAIAEQTQLTELLWPEGIVLFTETGSVLSANIDLWTGHWTCLTRPKFDPIQARAKREKDTWAKVETQLQNSKPGNIVQLGDFLAALLNTISKIYKFSSEIIGTEKLESLLAPLSTLEVDSPLIKDWISKQDREWHPTTEPYPLDRLESSIKAVALNESLEPWVWAFPVYRCFIESWVDLKSPIYPEALDALIESSQETSFQLLKPIYSEELENSSQINLKNQIQSALIIFRSQLCKQAGVRRLSMVLST